MKLSSNINNSAAQGLLLSVLLAFPTTAATAIERRIAGERAGATIYKELPVSRRLADCTAEDFLVTRFVRTEASEDGVRETAYEGCYEAADTLDGEPLYTIDGDLTAVGGVFFASDNNGGNPDTSWYFAPIDEGSTAQNATNAFLCFDLDLSPTADTHPADVTTWGLTRDENVTNVVRECDITITCGCSTDSPTPAPVEAGEDDDAVGATEGDAAFAITVGGTHLVLVLTSMVLMVANLL